jgi:threonine dehydratase
METPTMFSLAEIEAAATVVYRTMPPTPQYCWPLLSEAVGTEVWVKHENHTPLGAFKVRGGLLYLEWLKRERPEVAGVIAATRGNHGQSVAFAARRFGLRARIVVPHGNSREKNAAMRAHGAELVEFGHDFQAAYDEARQMAAREGFHLAPSFGPLLVKGVATYALEFFRACPNLHTVYVPIGLGSGICGLITVRDLLRLPTEIVGVVAEGAPAYALSFAAGHPVETAAADTFVDGVACRQPDPAALAIILQGAARVVQVSDEAVREAMRLLYRATHNLAEPAGAAALAALLQERQQMAARRVGIVLTGANVDLEVFRSVLGGPTNGQ